MPHSCKVREYTVFHLSALTGHLTLLLASKTRISLLLFQWHWEVMVSVAAWASYLGILCDHSPSCSVLLCVLGG